MIGYRSEFLTDTKGNGIMNHIFMAMNRTGRDKHTGREVRWWWEAGEAVTYGLYNVQERGALFVRRGPWCMRE